MASSTARSASLLLASRSPAPTCRVKQPCAGAPPSTATSPRRGRRRSREAVGQTLTVTAPAPATVDHFDLTVFADGHHSVPTTLAVSADGRRRRWTWPCPPIADDTTVAENAPATVRVALPAARHRSDADRRPERNSGGTGAGLHQWRASRPARRHRRAGRRRLPPRGAGRCASRRVPPRPRHGRRRTRPGAGDGHGRAPPWPASRWWSSRAMAPLMLGAGRHDLRTAVGRDLGIDVDRWSSTPRRRRPSRPGRRRHRSRSPARRRVVLRRSRRRRHAIVLAGARPEPQRRLARRARRP